MPPATRGTSPYATVPHPPGQAGKGSAVCSCGSEGRPEPLYSPGLFRHAAQRQRAVGQQGRPLQHVSVTQYEGHHGQVPLAKTARFQIGAHGGDSRLARRRQQGSRAHLPARAEGQFPGQGVRPRGHVPGDGPQVRGRQPSAPGFAGCGGATGFNPRTRAGCDESKYRWRWAPAEVSIHAPARGATNCGPTTVTTTT